ncbi:MAG: hypothetical protein QOG19_3535, partial [Mycobacterium sp.]|nr:hypothetical protein [Mycobacterium sp.]
MLSRVAVHDEYDALQRTRLVLTNRVDHQPRSFSQWETSDARSESDQSQRTAAQFIG